MDEPTYPSVPPQVLMPQAPVDLSAVDQLADPGYELAQAPEPVERARAWRPTTEQEAEWAMAQLAACTRELDGIEQQRRLWVEQIDAWAGDARRGPAHRAAFFEGALQGYVRERHDADPKVRTLHLPSGTLQVRVPQKGTVQVEEHGPLISWLESDVGAEHLPTSTIIKRPEPSVLVSELRKHVQAVQVDGQWVAIVPGTGETPPGVTAAPPAEPTYTVKPD